MTMQTNNWVGNNCNTSLEGTNAGLLPPRTTRPLSNGGGTNIQTTRTVGPASQYATVTSAAFASQND